jgi:predicted transcriptional regulator
VNAFRYRDRIAIIGDILKALKDSREGKKKTQIMHSANLNYIQLGKYMHYLLHYGFVKITEDGKIDITDEGAKFLLFLEVQKIPAIV